MSSLLTQLPTSYRDSIRPLSVGADIDTWKKEAGMDWEIESSDIYYNVAGDDVSEKSIQEFPKRKALYRSDTKKALGIVSPNYKIVQPGEVLEFYKDLVAEGGYQLETAGVMQHGKRFWAMAKTGNQCRVKGQDVLQGYLLLSTGCDGLSSTRVFFTSFRLSCLNALNIALHGKDDSVPSIRVTHAQDFDAGLIKEQLGVLDKSWDVFENTVNTLADKKVSREEAVNFFLDTFYTDEKEVDISKRGTVIHKVLDVYEFGKGQDLISAKHTAWGLVNAVTRYLDHESGSRSVNARLNRAWFGSGVNIKKRAYEAAIKLAA